MSAEFEDPRLFYIVVPPYFERLALYELNAHLRAQSYSLEKYEIHAGGIELTLPFSLGLSLNAYLKIPTRVLIRLETREVLSFKDLEAFFKTIDWKVFGPLREVYVSSRSSKMKMKDAIKEAFKKTIPFKAQKTGTDVYIRMFRDQCTVSVDTSGDDLFVRGYQKWTGEAPIRDTFAAGLLQLSLQGVQDLSQWEIVDPMMGSGTFLSEALLVGRPAARGFCFQNWNMPGLPELDAFRAPASEPILNVTVRGRDKDPKNVEIVKKNLAVLRLKNADVKVDDLFSNSVVSPAEGKKRLVILNPPYGKRLAVKDKNFFQNALSAIYTKYSPDRVGVIVPRSVELAHGELEKLRHFSFSNNGIDVDFFVFLKK